jgi:AbrB family looped-hinge helix DNA binding protein
MTTTTLSPKFQIVIPTAIRRQLTLRKGMKFQVIPYGQRIELIPIEPMTKAKGLLKGIDTTIRRSPDRSL